MVKCPIQKSDISFVDPYKALVFHQDKGRSFREWQHAPRLSRAKVRTGLSGQFVLQMQIPPNLDPWNNIKLCSGLGDLAGRSC